jgi:hypothetical protein
MLLQTQSGKAPGFPVWKFGVWKLGGKCVLPRFPEFANLALDVFQAAMKPTIILKFSVAAAVISVCAPGPSLSAESSAVHEIKIGYTSMSISAFPIEFARRKGFFSRWETQCFDDRYENERHHERPAYPRDRLLVPPRPPSSEQPPATCR